VLQIYQDTQLTKHTRLAFEYLRAQEPSWFEGVDANATFAQLLLCINDKGGKPSPRNYELQGTSEANVLEHLQTVPTLRKVPVPVCQRKMAITC